MHHIRPYQIFSLVEGSPADRVAAVPIPHRRWLGGISLLETFLLIAASRFLRARRLFEFGTFLGSTTLVMALNVPENGEIITLDLEENKSTGLEQESPDARLTEIHLASKKLDFAGAAVARKIKTIAANSIEYDFSPWKESIDLVFIDGGHDIDTVKCDTTHAFDMVARDKPSCIFWHDYGNSDYSGLTYYLDTLSQSEDIFHIGSTMLCVWFNDPEKRIVSRLNR